MEHKSPRLEEVYEQLVGVAGNQEEDPDQRILAVRMIQGIGDSNFVKHAIAHSRDTAVANDRWYPESGRGNGPFEDRTPATLTVGNVCTQWLYSFFAVCPKCDPVENWSEWFSSMQSKGLGIDEMRRAPIEAHVCRD